jgi:RsmE family RNA methyltransferase
MKRMFITAQILSASKKEVAIAITGDYTLNTESNLNIILIQGLLKGEKMDFVIQKTTELGVSAIIPVITERSQLRETRKHPRWKKIAGGPRQSGRTKIQTFEHVYLRTLRYASFDFRDRHYFLGTGRRATSCCCKQAFSSRQDFPAYRT